MAQDFRGRHRSPLRRTPERVDTQLRCVDHRILGGTFVRVAGSPKARGTVLWIHGLGESGLCFEHLLGMDELSDWLHVAPDLPGYGRSCWRSAPLSIDGLADHLVEVLRDLGEYPRPLVLIGHSMGGMVTLRLAERNRHLPTAVVDVEGNVSPDDCTFSEAIARDTPSEFVQRGFVRFQEQIHAKTSVPGSGNAWRGYYASLRFADPRAVHLNSRELVELSRSGSLARRRSRFRLLYVAGLQNGLSRRGLAFLRSAHVTVKTIEDAGHWPFLDQPTRFVDVLRDFLWQVR